MIDYEEDWLFKIVFSCNGSVFCQSLYFAFPAVIVATLLSLADIYYPGWRELLHIGEVMNSQTWSCATASLIFVIGFRTNRALSRFWEGTGLLHQMRGEWFDTVSNCVTFSILAKKKKPLEVMRFRHTLVRLMSLCHGNALEEISGNAFQIETIDIHGIDVGTLKHLKQCAEVYNFNKVEVLLHLIQSLITKAFEDEVLAVPAPIVSRVFQTISRGFVNLLNTKKITDTKFPFPYAQLIAILLITNVFVTPFMLTDVLQSPIAACLLAFVQVFALASLNYISMELENPFGRDENDLPLNEFQAEMNSCLLMLLHPQTDMIATTSPHCIMDFEELKGTLEMYASESGDQKPFLKRFDTAQLGGMLSRQSLSSTRSRSPSWQKEEENDEEDSEDGNGTKEAADTEDPDENAPKSGPEVLEVTGTWAVVPALATADGQTAPPPNGDATAIALDAPKDKVPAAGPGRPDDLDVFLTKGIDQLNRSLDNWTKVMQDQVNEMSSNFHALRSATQARASAH
eukprot:TRINITY_DN17995_c0_g1_i1.p1 TRINITY_DN17995_c0_g1~~TRINITY_DN17995_c0_g1_i1.p1  ORF type:complete len:514 (+),score=103.64 TRINITY_DN17995_c0_g1_i1:123-1664(+)